MNTSNKHQFKFRAECLIDFVKLLGIKNSCVLSYCIESTHLPDVEVELTLDEGCGEQDLRNQMLLVEDSHVMRDTLATVDEYTGERR